MDQTTKTLCLQIVQYNNALAEILLGELKELMQGEYGELSTKQLIVLDMLRTQNRTVSEIANYFAITPSAASQLLSKMERTGYVRREINPQNRREMIIQLGHKGLAYNRLADDTHLQLVEKYYGTLSHEDLQTFLSLHEKLYKSAKVITSRTVGESI